MELPPLWHSLSATLGHTAVMETRMAGHGSSLGLETLAAQSRDCQREVCPRWPTALDWPRPRPRLLAILKLLLVPPHVPRAAPTVVTPRQA